jgi:hypothetical protein
VSIQVLVWGRSAVEHVLVRVGQRREQVMSFGAQGMPATSQPSPK